MNRELSQKVISYRVREFDDQNFVVESYTMQLRDELFSYLYSETDYYIRYNSYIKNKRQFQEFIGLKCRSLGYAYEPKDNIEEFNAFLATHYFKPGIAASQRDGSIEELNKSAREYIEKYNDAIRRSKNLSGESIHSVDNTQLSRAQSFLRNGIAHIECVNVGQANFSIGYDTVDHKACAVFDIGIRSSKAAVRNRAYAKNKLQQIDGNGVIIISHYDFDHINGYRYITRPAADRIWILPAKRLSPTPAERNLFNRLIPGNCIFLNDIDYSKTPFDPKQHVLTIGNIRIYRGNAQKTDPFQSTSENARCLMCVVQKNASILLPADCLYEEFPTSFDVDYLAVPHHSCYYDKPIKNIAISALKELIVFSGPNRKYRHPDLSHINKLNQNGCQVVYLMNHGNFYFDHRSEVTSPPIMPTSPFYIVTL